MTPARYMDCITTQQHHARLARLYLAEAIRLRDESLRTRSPDIRRMCRRDMRNSARCWRRKWGDL